MANVINMGAGGASFVNGTVAAGCRVVYSDGFGVQDKTPTAEESISVLFNSLIYAPTNIEVSPATATDVDNLYLVNSDFTVVKGLSDTFGENTWEAIINACQNNKVPAAWAVGNSKTMIIDNNEYQIDIIGKNHDTYADNSGKAPLTLQLHSVYGSPVTTYGMTKSTTTVAWPNTTIRSSVLPSIKSKMPSEVAAAIKAVKKEYISSLYDSSVSTCSDSLFLLSTYEVFGATKYSRLQQGTQYDYYKTTNNRKKKGLDNTGYSWWLRSIGENTNSSPSKPTYCAVDDTGNCYTVIQYVEYDKYNKLPISFAFCF